MTDNDYNSAKSPNHFCRSCGHTEGEHHGLGCRHWNGIELRTEDAIHTDMSICGCAYFNAREARAPRSSGRVSGSLPEAQRNRQK